MTLPDNSEGGFALLKPGKYTFRITDPPEKRRFGEATGIIVKFSAIDEFGEAKDGSVLIFPFPDRETGYHPYKILKDEIIKSNEEIDWVGKSFLGEIEVGPHPTKPNRQVQKIVNIQPFGDQPVKDTTPPPEEEEDPGPEEEDPYPNGKGGEGDPPF